MSELVKHLSRLSFVNAEDLDPKINLAGGLAACFLTIVCFVSKLAQSIAAIKKKLEAAVEQ